MRFQRPLVVGVLLLGLAACSPEALAPSPEAPAPLAAPASSAVAPASAAAPLPETSAAPPPPAGSAPPLEPAAPPAAPEASRDAQLLNGRALQAHRREDWPAAIDLYIQALRLASDHILARYNLACAYARSGARAEALEQLRQLRQAACPLCLKQLDHARSDADFKDLWADASFRSLTAPAEPPPGEAPPAPEASPAPEDSPKPEASPDAGDGIDRLTPSQLDGVGLLEVAVAAAVEDRAPVGAGRRFSVDDGTLALWLNAANPTGAAVEVTVVWLREGEGERARNTLKIGAGKSWKSWGLLRLRATDAGAWTVEVRDPTGAVLHRIAFEVSG